MSTPLNDRLRHLRQYRDDKRKWLRVLAHVQDHVIRAREFLSPEHKEKYGAGSIGSKMGALVMELDLTTLVTRQHLISVQTEIAALIREEAAFKRQARRNGNDATVQP